MLGLGVANLRVGHCFIGSGVGPHLSGPKVFDLVIFLYILFLLCFSFLKNNELFVYIFSNKFLVYI